MGLLVPEKDRYRYIIWEFIHGEALDSRLARACVPPRTVACIGRDVATALCAIWAKRVVHRDVNPKNIMLRIGEDGAVLIDLGVAKYLDQTPLTALGFTWGTKGYLSPEQVLGTQLTVRPEPGGRSGRSQLRLGLAAQYLEPYCSSKPTPAWQNSEQTAFVRVTWFPSSTT